MLDPDASRYSPGAPVATLQDEFLRRAQSILDAMEAGPLFDEAAQSRPYVEETLGRMMEAARAGALPPRAERPEALTWMVLDSWPSGTELGKEIREVEALYRRL